MRKSTQGKSRRGGSRTQEFPGVSHYKDRHGKLRWRYRDGQSTVNLGTEYGSPDFLRRYSAAVNGVKPAEGGVGGAVYQAPASSIPDRDEGKPTLSQLIDEWYRSAQFSRLAQSTSRDYENVAENLRKDYGENLVEDLNRSSVKLIMQKKADRPEGANKDLRILRLLFDHAVEPLEWVEVNPARDVKKYAPLNRQGYYTWTEQDIAKFQERWPEGTLADLAMSLMLYTGSSRGDAVELGPNNVAEMQGKPRLRYRRKKMQTRGGVLVDIPVHPELKRRLDARQDVGTFLQTGAGHQRSAAGLGNSMRDWCDAASLPNCSSHGLRKACARRLAEAGATPHEIMAVTGHETLSEVERYTKAANRGGLADRALDRLG